MDKKYIITFKNINEDYTDDVEGNLEALFSDVVDFAQDVDIEEIE